MLKNLRRALLFVFRSTCAIKKLNYEKASVNIIRHCTNSKMVRVLNVAEKNDAAKSIAEIMCNGRFRRREGRSVYNKIYEFEYNLFNQRCQMVMTSVSGHLLNLEFAGSYRKWQWCNPVTLFDAPVVIECLQDYQPIKATLEAEAKKCHYLIIWTDCDREGENIGFEIIDVCKKVQPSLKVFRARFSEITSQAIHRACANLGPPDEHMNDAVNVRRELDLRIGGKLKQLYKALPVTFSKEWRFFDLLYLSTPQPSGAAFTRFQTLRLKKVFPDILGNQLISYGSCQFPTLGFVVERYKQVQAFIPEPFWKLKVTHKKDAVVTEFSWKRGRLFDHTACLVLYQMCLEEPTARVVDIKSRNKSKWRPQPLDTVEFEKLVSRKLHINAKEAMAVAEKLYTKGFISYPRTETKIFPKELNLTALVEMQCEDSNWGAFALRVKEWGPDPRQGTKTDNAHPPIHPTKYTNTLQGNEKTIYEFVVRHFLACVSKDAEGRETTIEIEIKGERFAVNGLVIIARNYLDVYPYERWNAKVIGEYSPNEVFQPSSLEMTEGETSAPELLTEADLIGLMEKHGIGTDATHAEHIETIKSRLYVGVNENGRFIPGELGMGLVEGYDMMGFHMSKPHLRAELEADLKRITEGERDPRVVLREQVSKYKEYFIEAVRQAAKLDSALSVYFNVEPGQVVEDSSNPQLMPIMKCPKCQSGDIVLRTKRDDRGFFLSCMSYPNCSAVMWLPDSLEHISVLEEECEKCLPTRVKKVKLKFKHGTLMPFFPDEFVNCLGGCDSELMDVIDARPIASARNPSITPTSVTSTSRNASSDSGYESAQRIFHNNNASSSSATSRSSSTSSVRHHAFTRSQQPGFVPSRQLNRQPLNPVFSPNQMSNSSDDIVCNCGKKAIVLTVRKEGPNTGRQFYKCPEMAEDKRCGFFLWKDDESAQSSQMNSHQRPENNFAFRHSANANENSAVLCRCSFEARLLTVSKEGINKGRQFYACSKPREQSCGFFQWADADEIHARNIPQTQLAAGSSDRSTSQSHRRPASSNLGGPANKRKCGICKERGHNRKNCPLNR